MQKRKWISRILAFLLTTAGLPACNFPSTGNSLPQSSTESAEGVLSNEETASESMDGRDSSEESAESSSDASEESAESSSDSSEESVESSSDSSEESVESSSDGSEEIVAEEFSIHFLTLGNATPGDCTLIKVGDTEVLIDAGSTTGSVSTIVPYIQEYCTDGVLEYVIATHADSDHISGFVGGSKGKGIFDSFECKTIIDYALTNKTTQIKQQYEALRDKEVTEGATHYTAIECWQEINGASRSYTLGEEVTMQILYQKYYEQKSSDENNYSVCLLLTCGENHYLFTGDLETAGEKSLVESNDLPKCVLYKGGHHGSGTSSTPELLAKIQPEIVCVCTCCGDAHYNFPAQEFVDNIAKYTDKVYITTVVEGGVGKPLNGNIVVTTKEGEVSVNCSNNNLLFKDTDWFKANRTTPPEWE